MRFTVNYKHIDIATEKTLSSRKAVKDNLKLL